MATQIDGIGRALQPKAKSEAVAHPHSLVVVDDDPAFLALVEEWMTGLPEFHLLGTFSSAEGALRELPCLQPEIVVMDYKLPGMSGIDCIRRIERELGGIKVLLITGARTGFNLEDWQVIERTRGFLLKPFEPSEFVSTLKIIVGNGVVRGPGTRPPFDTAIRAWHPALSRRENEIMHLLCERQFDKKIADTLHISISSVRTHLRSINRKLGVHSRYAAAQAFRAKFPY